MKLFQITQCLPALALGALCLAPLSAQATITDVDGSVTNTVASTINNAAAAVWIGSNSPNNALNITNGGDLYNVDGFVLGYLVAADGHNSLTVSSGSTFGSTAAGYIGFYGTNNSVLVTGGGAQSQVSNNVFLGYYASSSNNSVTVSNGGSFQVAATGAFYIGDQGRGDSVLVTGGGSQLGVSNGAALGYSAGANNNSVTVSNGGSVTVVGGSTVGYAGSANSVFVTGASSAWQTSTTGTVGYDPGASNNTLTISNGGLWKSGSQLVGWNVGSSSTGCTGNSMLVTGAGSAAQIGTTMTIGYLANAYKNSVTVSNAGLVQLGSYDAVGYNGASNSEVITGTGSALLCGGNVSIGAAAGANYNSLTIAGGGQVTNASFGGIGVAGATNNSVLVTDPNSLWLMNTPSANGYLYMEGTASSLTVSNGATVEPYVLVNGQNSGLTSNSVVVTGQGSLINNNGGVTYVGYNGQFNTMTVSNGGQVLAGQGFIGANAGANYNSALVTGPGSEWMITNNLEISTGSYNSLTVSNGGVVSATSSSNYIGAAANSSYNNLIVTGAGSTLTLSGGTLTVGNSTANTNNILSLGNGGLLTNASSVILGGVSSTFNLGDGTAAATMAVNNILSSNASAELNINNGVWYATAALSGIAGPGSVNIASGGAVVNTQGNTVTIASSVGGGGALTQTGAGILVLSGTNPYTGGTIVSAGELDVSPTGSVLGNVTVSSAATLELDNATALSSGATLTLPSSPAAGSVNLNFSGTQTISALNFGSTSMAANTWGAIGSGANVQSAAFTGSGLLNVTSGGLTQTITSFPNPGPQTYGVPPISLSATASSSLPATFAVVSGPATVSGNTLTITGAGPVTVQAIQAGNTTYDPTATNLTFTVNPAVLTITANPASKTYGTTLVLGSSAFSVSGLVSPDTVTGVTLVSSGTALNAPVSGSPYPITPGAATGTLNPANYIITYVTNSLTVTALPVILEATQAYDSTTNVYAATLVVSNALAGDDVTLTNGPGGMSSADTGTNAITWLGTLALTGANASNYSLTGASGSVVVTPLPVTLSGSRPYDGTDDASALILTMGNALGSDNVSLASGSASLAGSAAGIEAITDGSGLVLGGSTASNYTVTGASGSVTVTTVPLTITADPVSKTYGTAITLDPTAFTISSGLLVGSESVTAVTMTATPAGTAATDPVGTYTITPGAGTGTGGFLASNYAITYNSALLAVNPLAVILNGGSRPSDGATDVSASILTIGNDLDGANLSLSGSAVLASAAVGVQPITSVGTVTLGGSAGASLTEPDVVGC